MQIKKFEAPTIQEALDAIKRELGPEAIILQTRRNRKGFGLMSNGSVEVTAAVSDKAMDKKKMGDKQLPEKDREPFFKMPAEKQSRWIDKVTDRYLTKGEKVAAEEKVQLSSRGRQMTATPYAEIDRRQVAAPQPQAAMPPAPTRVPQQAGPNPSGALMEGEVRLLKKLISDLRESQDALEQKVAKKGEHQEKSGEGAIFDKLLEQSPALFEAFEQLVLEGVERRIALSLVRHAQFELGAERSTKLDDVLDAVAAEIVRSVTTVNFPLASAQKRSLVLVGPSGVGKTTLLLKLATQAKNQGVAKVALVNLAPQGAGLVPSSLEAYSRLMQVPFRQVTTETELDSALKDLEPMDLIFFDTVGYPAKDAQSLQALYRLTSQIPNATCLLTLSSLTRDQEQLDLCARYGTFRPLGVALTRMDEANLFGGLLNVNQRSKLPFCFFGVGPRIPEDVENATPERAAALILNI